MPDSPDLEERLKIALDETRMLIMGVQILIGVQFQVIIQEGFAGLPAGSKSCIGVALVLMVCTAGLLIAPAAHHRLVEEGEASGRIVALTARLMETALFAFSIGIALDLYVTMERVVGTTAALGFAAAAFVVALLSWYAFALVFPTGRLKREQAMKEKTEPTPLSTKIDYMLTEARVILPGVQALLGFQLIAVFSRRFEQMPAELKLVHGVGLWMMTTAIILLLTPAAFHRLAFAGEDVPTVHTIGTIFVTAALAALAFGLGAEVMVATAVLSGRLDVGALVGSVILLVLFGLWYAWPLAIRARMQPRRT